MTLLTQSSTKRKGKSRTLRHKPRYIGRLRLRRTLGRLRQRQRCSIKLAYHCSRGYPSSPPKLIVKSNPTTTGNQHTVQGCVTAKTVQIPQLLPLLLDIPTGVHLPRSDDQPRYQSTDTSGKLRYWIQPDLPLAYTPLRYALYTDYDPFEFISIDDGM
ncbi:hypothetical protein MPER_08381 [Moniliophthora perniciosa FA553]|nr:hypothetical protein MPER_08381 [Moniliophthora perniciosa FA553]